MLTRCPTKVHVRINADQHAGFTADAAKRAHFFVIPLIFRLYLSKDEIIAGNRESKNERGNFGENITSRAVSFVYHHAFVSGRGF